MLPLLLRHSLKYMYFTSKPLAPHLSKCPKKAKGNTKSFTKTLQTLVATQTPSPSPLGQVHQDHLPCIRVTSPQTPGAPTLSPTSIANVPLLMQKKKISGMDLGKESQTRYPGKRHFSCYLAHLQIAVPPHPGEGSRSFLGRGISRTWGSFLSCLREPSAGHPFGSSFLGQDPEPPRGATRLLPVSSGRSSRQAQQLGQGNWAGWVPAGHSPPRLRVPSRPWWWAELDWQSGGRQPRGSLKAQLEPGYGMPTQSPCPLWLPRPPRGPRQKTKPEGQILMLTSSKPNSLSASLGQPPSSTQNPESEPTLPTPTPC